MFEAGVEHFLDPVQLRAPQVPEIVEAFVHRREALVNATELGIDVGEKDSINPALNNIGIPIAK
jgi:hypothetical protein